MLYILLGEDDYSLRQSLEEIKRTAGDPAMLSTNTTEMEGKQATPVQLRNVCETLPFLAEKRLVIVNGLLERFEPNARTGKKKKNTGQAIEQNGAQQFSASLGGMPDSTILVLIDSKVGKNNPLFNELSGKAVVKSFPALKGNTLEQWIDRKVAKEGGSISSQAVKLLARLVGGDLFTMSNEIDKLISFAAGRRIEEEDVKAMVSFAQETSVFAMVDAILEARASLAEQMLQRLLQAGVAPAYIMTMIARQLRMLVQMKELKAQRKSRAEMMKALGTTSEFVLNKTSAQSDRFAWGRLMDLYHRLLEADLSIKTGKFDEELALDMLIAEICQQERP